MSQIFGAWARAGAEPAASAIAKAAPIASTGIRIVAPPEIKSRKRGSTAPPLRFDGQKPSQAEHGDDRGRLYEPALPDPDRAAGDDCNILLAVDTVGHRRRRD